MRRRHVITSALILLLSINSCNKLEIENPNLPDTARVLSSPEAVKQLVQESFLKYWQAIKGYNFGLQAPVMADHTTGCCFGWLLNSKEPRLPWNNDLSGSANNNAEYYDLFTVISNVNDALVEIKLNDVNIGPDGKDNPMVEASAYLIRGLSLGQLALTYDQCMVPLHDDDFTALEFFPWNEVLEKAIEDLGRAIHICQTNSFTWPEGTVSGMTMNNTYISQLANSYSARFLAMGARNKSENDDLSWTSKYSWTNVITFAQNGITADFAPIGNGLPWQGGTWWDLNVKYLRQPGFARNDCRIINLLDPDYPIRYPTKEDGWPLDPPEVHEDLQPGEAKSNDVRLITDFKFYLLDNLRPERGGYHFSHYRHSRYDYPPTTNSEGNYMGESIGPIKELTVFDNELMLAEAYARTNNVSEAASILNKSTNPRKVRGGLADVPATFDDVIEAIFYERDIELSYNGYGIHFFDMRRRDMLQYGTPLHLPVPAKDLEILNLNNYTYGGIENADGINTSNGGDWIKPYYHFTPDW